MTTLLQSMLNVDKSDNNRTSVDPEALAYALNIRDLSYGNFDEDEFDRRLSMYWLETWICTDTRVGYAAVYFDNLLVALFKQKGRKWDKEFDFINTVVVTCVQKFIQSIIEYGDSFSLIPESALHEEIEFGGWID